MDDIPTWRDIFDGKVRERQKRFFRVALDSDCMELSTREVIGIDKRMASPCAASELYKYATYIDVCETAWQKISFFPRCLSELKILWRVSSTLASR